MTDGERNALAVEWQRNCELLATLPENHAQRSGIDARQHEIAAALAKDDMAPTREWDLDDMD